MSSPIHFISGLPRSGSTLLSAILSQNPRFNAGMTSPLITLVGGAQAKMTGGEFHTFFNDTRRETILKGIFQGYHPELNGDAKRQKVVFDTNRAWTARLALINRLYPDAKVICCVREIGWIVDSIELMLTKNPLQVSRIFGFQSGASLASRADILMNHEKGLVGLSWTNLREAWFSALSHKLIVVPYEKLVAQPQTIIRSLYHEIQEPHFDHDFANLHHDEPEFDSESGMPGLHKVRQTITKVARRHCLPPEVFNRFSALSFWGAPIPEGCGAKILNGKEF